MAMAVILLTVLGAGCAKQPATMTASAPAPTGSGATPTPTSDRGSTSRAPAGTGAADRAGARPAPKEFRAMADLVDVHFDFDRYDIRPDAARVLEANARVLRSRGNYLLLIEGHCDERGTSEYNLALGERRAKAAMNALVSRGIDTRRITIVSYGEDQPQCRERTEACWAKNRRARFLVKDR